VILNDLPSAVRAGPAVDPAGGKFGRSEWIGHESSIQETGSGKWSCAPSPGTEDRRLGKSPGMLLAVLEVLRNTRAISFASAGLGQ